MLEMEEAPGGADDSMNHGSQNNSNSILPLTTSQSHHSQQQHQHQLLSHQSSHHSHQSNPASGEDTDAIHPLDLPAAISTQPSEEEMLMIPLMTANSAGTTGNVSSEEPENSSIRSRTKIIIKDGTKDSKSTRRRRRRKRKRQHIPVHYCAAHCPAPFVRSTLNVMNFLARLLFWGSVVAMVAAVVWYSRELKENGYVIIIKYMHVYSVLCSLLVHCTPCCLSNAHPLVTLSSSTQTILYCDIGVSLLSHLSHKVLCTL